MTPSGPRWLDDEEQHAWRSFRRAALLLLDQLDRELRRDAGMPHAYYEILVVLSESPDRRLRMGDLAAQLLSSPSRLTHAVSRLEERGWVRRDPAPDDRRGQVATLTDEGFAALAAAAPGHVEGVRTHLVEVLAREDLRQLGRSADDLLDHLTRVRTDDAASP